MTRISKEEEILKLPSVSSQISESSQSTRSNDELASWSHQNYNWIGCAKWLDSMHLLPIRTFASLRSQKLTAFDFATCLKDGEILCALVNILIPDSILDLTLKRQTSCEQEITRKQISRFLDVCKSALKLNDHDLFDPATEMSDPVDFGKVINTLSIISNSELAEEKSHLLGFRAVLKISEARPKKSESFSSKMYEIEELKETNSKLNDVFVESYPNTAYIDDNFFNLYTNRQSDDEKTYRKLVENDSSNINNNILQPMQRDYVIKDILQTEENFVRAMNMFAEDFIEPLFKVLNDQDKACVFMNLNRIIQVHTRLKNEIAEACKGGQGRTKRICLVFESLKMDLMKEYAEYFWSIDEATRRSDRLRQTQSSPTEMQEYLNRFKMTLDECQKKSQQGSYKFNDLICLPYQRILKYHLLFGELLKQTDVEHSAKDLIEKTKSSIIEMGNYLNECKRDRENLTRTEKIHKFWSQSNSNTNKVDCMGFIKNYGRMIKQEDFIDVKTNEFSLSDRSSSIVLCEKAMMVFRVKDANAYTHKLTINLNEYSIDEQAKLSGKRSATMSDLNASIKSPPSFTEKIIFTFSLVSNNATKLSLNHQTNPDKNITLSFKSKERMQEWEQKLSDVMKNLRIVEICNRTHKFELTNFDRELAKCTSCGRYLLGLVYQGYKCCGVCKAICHFECLDKFTQNCCKIISNNDLESVSGFINEENQSQETSFTTKVIFPYGGKTPQNDRYPNLVLSRGQLVQVTDTSHIVNWRGYIQSDNEKKEGIFPKHCVRICTPLNNDESNHISIKNYIWFSSADRSLAGLILSRLNAHTPLHDTLFMVRPKSDQINHVISVIYEGEVVHIEIKRQSEREECENLNKIKNRTKSDSSHQGIGEKFFISPNKQFDSIVELINYYSSHSLNEIFDNLDTNLGQPYLDALPNPIGKAVAQENYSPPVNLKKPVNYIKLEKNKHYFIVRKEPNRLWYVFDQEGLLGFAQEKNLHEIEF